MTEIEHKLETQFDLEKYLAKWVNILNLDDWQIVIKFDDKLGSLGETRSTGVNKQAAVSLLSHKEYLSRDFPYQWDMEETLVHELLHLCFCDLFHAIPESALKLSGYFEERLIEDLARSFVKLERAKNGINRT